MIVCSFFFEIGGVDGKKVKKTHNKNATGFDQAIDELLRCPRKTHNSCSEL